MKAACYNMDMLQIRDPQTGLSAVCEPILRSLPDWFGIEEATAQYIRDIETMPTILACVDGSPVGFLTVRKHNPLAAEIHVMGILPEYHRHGIGRRMLERAEAVLRAEGVRFLQVKTLSASHPDPSYARTRLFYQAMGFCPLEEFPTLWDAGNPCLQMVKWLGCS